jgi:hypothetical protein
METPAGEMAYRANPGSRGPETLARPSQLGVGRPTEAMDGTFVPFTWGELLLRLGARKIELRPARSQPAAHHAQIKEYIKYDHSNGNAAKNSGCSPQSALSSLSRPGD